MLQALRCMHAALRRELKRKERLEREMRDLRASLDARQQEIRDKAVAVQQSAEHVAKLQVRGAGAVAGRGRGGWLLGGGRCGRGE